MYAHVLVQVDAPLPQPLTYLLPETLDAALGDAVLVPFGHTEAVGHIVGLDVICAPEIAAKARPIAAKLENTARLEPGQFDLACWVSDQTLCSLRDAVRLVVPVILTNRIATLLQLEPDWLATLTATTRSAIQQDAAQALAALGGCAEIGKVANSLGVAKLGATATELARKGVLKIARALTQPQAKKKVVRVLCLSLPLEEAAAEATKLEAGRAHQQARLLRSLIAAETESAAGLPVRGVAIDSRARAAAHALAAKGWAAYVEMTVRRSPLPLCGIEKSSPPPLTNAQTLAAEAIGRHIREQDGKTVLLHGVTGSGKTEVYLEAVGQALACGRGSLILFPEIGLTAQVLDHFRVRFPEEMVAVLHSGLSLGERHDEWRRIQSGEARIVLGARSAVFAPIVDLGLMILDEEHDGSYKQDNAPRYHARDVAQERARRTGAPVLLGSATPALETYFRANTGEYELLVLAERIDSRPLPPVEIVDLREEMAQMKRASASDAPPGSEKEPRPASVLGVKLASAIEERLRLRQQVILYVNRRGFASFLLCRDCGYTPRCPHCDISLTYHKSRALLQCHHCDHREQAPEACPRCAGARMRPFGLGTEKVEQAIAQDYPHARTLRMDRDTMARKGAHAETLRTFRRGEADILIGTQMVAKGLDFPNVTLVGVVSADTALNIPDFRSSERAFQLLTQVAGRAGRGKTPGQVIVQTFSPEHESVQRAAMHDYAGFYEQAIRNREEVGYPPFSSMANLVCADENEQAAHEQAAEIASALRTAAARMPDASEILGPVACPLSRLRGQYRYHVVARLRDRGRLLNLVRSALADLREPAHGLSIDIDPLSML